MQLLADALLELGDISVDESEQLPAIFLELTESAADAALGIGRKEREDEESGSMRDALFHAAPALAKLKACVLERGVSGCGCLEGSSVGPSLWRRHSSQNPKRTALNPNIQSATSLSHQNGNQQEILNIMEIRLSEIAERWEDGRLSALGLKAGEVASLVRALFEDTAPRRSLLTALARAS